MAWQELLTSSQDISLDRDGYVHFTRTFRITGGNPRNFFATGTAAAPFLSIPILNVGQTINGVMVLPAFMPDFGHRMNVAVGPSFVTTEDGSNAITPVDCFLHDYTLRPGAIHFDAIAHYTNDPRIAPLGVGLSTAQQQSMVSIPYARRAPLAFGSQNRVSFGYVESYFSTPMAVEAITHTVMVPRSTLKSVESALEARAKELHVLPIHVQPCLFLGGDIRLHGVHWLEVTYHWQWQQGVKFISAVPPKTYTYEQFDGAGRYVATGNANMIVPANEVKPMYPNTSDDAYVLPPYHTMDMRFEFTSIGNISNLMPRWYFQMPYKTNVSGWRSLPGASKFIWSTG